MIDWFHVANRADIPTPALLVYPDRIRENIRRMTAGAGAEDVVLGYQPVGPNVDRLLELAARFPSVRFSCVADNPGSVGDLSDAAARSSTRLEVLLDLDVGQHRTGIAPDAHAFDLYRLIAALPALAPGGLHAYDGHIHDSDVAA